MVSISDIDIYNAGMNKSMEDKMWWIDKVAPQEGRVLDYGCADGALLREVAKLKPDWDLRGYDFNPDMIDIAKNHQRENCVPIWYSSDWAELVRDALPEIVVASSVFHEIENYSRNKDVDYAKIFHSARYIAIRDMFFSEKHCGFSDSFAVSNIHQFGSTEKIAEFEAIYGSLSSRKNLVHYLLKYRYETNWNREVRENYFPHSLEEFLAKIPKEYEIIYFEHYTLPFLREQVSKDFNIILETPTHAKILLRKKDDFWINS